ncbi:hypothetical protein [Geomesophilobacter sediminis]|uniref:Uncharacterized protein n=1 Tax=Geomesophilobacter sediminis TaxID=2798584 RepID=A0A8J7M2M9_9BACT|nr:hypothetical protein [Geomesophilobacter sediminis]MBJ6727188.1 hypothetical protein [Geomesophilobacter sediminis]
MSEVDKICEAVTAAADNWPFFGDGDSNLVDIYWLAEKLRETLGAALPTDLPPKDCGVQAFETVETILLRDPQDRVLRVIPVDEIVQRLVNLMGALKKELPFSGEDNLLVSLYLWHGCIRMAKLLRCAYNIRGGQALYTPQMRSDEYALILNEWTQDEAQGNSWVRYGVSLARRMEQARKKQDFDFEVHENWIPKDSPYWEP